MKKDQADVQIFIRKIPGNTRKMHAGRALVRELLQMQEEPMSKTPDGKPYFTNHPEISFSISDCGEYVAVALSKKNQIVGIDLEAVRTVSERMISRFFSEGEQRGCKHLSDVERQKAFIEVWTRKEAFSKYLGCGLRGDLRKLDTTEGFETGKIRTYWIRGNDGEEMALSVALDEPFLIDWKGEDYGLI